MKASRWERVGEGRRDVWLLWSRRNDGSVRSRKAVMRRKTKYDECQTCKIVLISEMVVCDVCFQYREVQEALMGRRRGARNLRRWIVWRLCRPFLRWHGLGDGVGAHKGACKLWKGCVSVRA